MDLNEFLQAPRESLNIELKAWIDPSTPEGKAKVVKAAIALRNINGGYLGIGISNDGLPLTSGVPEDFDNLFHQDAIQALIARHSSETFEVSVEFGEFQGVRFPFIVIPPGVRTPVAAKLGILDPKSNQKELVKKDTVYVRTLGANNTPSTAAALFSDWPQIMSVCFDNREADIGYFLRRHLANIDISGLLEHFGGGQVKPKIEIIDAFLNECRQRFIDVPKADDAKDLGRGRVEYAFIINSAEERQGVRADTEFLSSFLYANPHHSGWPLWIDSRGFQLPSDRPKVRSKGWEVLIEDYVGSFILPHLDFWRVEPPGRFYHARVLLDDTIAIKQGRKTNQIFSVDLAISGVAEAISVAISFAKSMGFSINDTTLKFAFRWSGLAGRQLGSYDLGRYISPGKVCEDDEVISHLEIPLDLSPSSIPSLIPDVVGDLFSLFNGMSFSSAIVESIASEQLKKRF